MPGIHRGEFPGDWVRDVRRWITLRRMIVLPLYESVSPHVRLMTNSENVGFSRANNQAICQSTGRYMLLLNPDTKVLPGALETLGRVFI